MLRVDGVFDEVPEFELRRRAAAGVTLAALFERYRGVFAEAERAPRPMILVPRDRDVVSPADAGPELVWHGDAYVEVTPGPTRTAPVADFDAALAELYRPVDPRVWAVTPEPCAPPMAAVEPPLLPTVSPVDWKPPRAVEELPPSRWSRPLWMWP